MSKLTTDIATYAEETAASAEQMSATTQQTNASTQEIVVSVEQLSDQSEQPLAPHRAAGPRPLNLKGTVPFRSLRAAPRLRERGATKH